MVYTNWVFTSIYLIWYSRDKFPQGFEWQNIADIKKYRVGLVSGYSYGEEIDTAISQGEIKFTTVSSLGQLIIMLTRNRVDLMLAEQAAADFLLQQSGASQVVAAEKPTGTDTLYIAFSRKSAASQLVEPVNQIIVELREAGIIDRILQKNWAQWYRDNSQ